MIRAYLAHHADAAGRAARVVGRRSGGRSTTCAIPPGMLITLVENAIKHGIEPLPRGGRVDVTARVDARGRRRVVLSVADTGAGLAGAPGAAASASPTSASGSRCCYGERARARARRERAARIRRARSSCRSAQHRVAGTAGTARSKTPADDRPTALIAEDEPLMRERLKEKLAEAWPELDDRRRGRRRRRRRSRCSTIASAADRVPRHPDAGAHAASTSRPRSAANATSSSSPPTTSTR